MLLGVGRSDDGVVESDGGDEPGPVAEVVIATTALPTMVWPVEAVTVTAPDELPRLISVQSK